MKPARKKIRESAAALKKRAGRIIERLAEAHPARIELEFSNPLELAVATILSAQCTDARVNEVTRDLFSKYRTADDYSNADPEVFQEEIRSTGFFRNKARSIISFARSLVELHGGVVPNTMDELVQLTGIGRKTANVILGSAFGANEGIAVDTHVKRVARRLGLSAEYDPDKIERDLMKLVPRDSWTEFSLRMIQHGRYRCSARSPQCAGCALEDLCPSAGDF
ncbi:MAG: endonuclease III [Gemmatimonadetes bacterium]|nr:endonuclease III [Gemmatimonadota bacterium]NIO32098.1 endonuclease III [Gemmatimonadota bacterium]